MPTCLAYVSNRGVLLKLLLDGGAEMLGSEALDQLLPHTDWPLRTCLAHLYAKAAQFLAEDDGRRMCVRDH
jgi:hypothetical protein